METGPLTFLADLRMSWSPVVTLKEPSFSGSTFQVNSVLSQTVERSSACMSTPSAAKAGAATPRERGTDEGGGHDRGHPLGVFESESAPFPLTHRVPFGHDAVNGERGAWDGTSVAQVFGRVVYHTLKVASITDKSFSRHGEEFSPITEAACPTNRLVIFGALINPSKEGQERKC